VIEFYNLVDSSKGYNKTTGGRGGYRVSEETRRKLSISHYGEKNYWFGKRHTKESREKMSEKLRGESNHWLGKRHTEETRAKMSEKLSGKNSPWFGRKHTSESRQRMSEKHKDGKNKGGKHSLAKPICVFGKIYGAASEASDILRDVCDTNNKGNFIADWVRSKRHQHNVFYISKGFYESMVDTTICITREMYNNM
jgi:hypothetical protein